ncbi:MAG: 3-isopropylmalate dehydratase large subunit [Vicinamibacteria bacterium]|nr:3-isopropylmalate dehydratase large subunit [Vicinamibacteria bacterium]
MGQTLLQKVWDAHTVRRLPTGQTQLFIGLHLVHEVTSPQAFDMLDARGWKVAFPQRTFATVDHIVPTRERQRPFLDVMAEQMMSALESNCAAHGIPLYNIGDAHQGIVHVIGPELGLTQPGMTIACGDSHTSTHGAFGSVAFGIGTSQVRDVLASQCLALEPLQVRRIDVTGRLAQGVYAKDVILEIIRQLGVKGGAGYAYEYGGPAVDRMSMDERMTICNMSIEGAARVGYVNPDQTTFSFLQGRAFAPQGEALNQATAYWRGLVSDADAHYDDRVTIDGDALEPTVTWGINPGQSVPVSGRLPDPRRVGDQDRAGVEEALQFMSFDAGAPIMGTRIDVAFIGSCTNSRLSDLREAARVVRGHHLAPHVKGLVVPGSDTVRQDAEREGLHEIFREAGFEWRGAGCSMCLAMNPDRLQGREVCASSSNRNFKGRQGSPTGRTLLMSPAMVAAAAVAGEVVDVRPVLANQGVTA